MRHVLIASATYMFVIVASPHVVASEVEAGNADRALKSLKKSVNQALRTVDEIEIAPIWHAEWIFLNHNTYEVYGLPTIRKDAPKHDEPWMTMGAIVRLGIELGQIETNDLLQRYASDPDKRAFFLLLLNDREGETLLPIARKVLSVPHRHVVLDCAALRIISKHGRTEDLELARPFRASSDKYVRSAAQMAFDKLRTKASPSENTGGGMATGRVSK